jgi:hypothetical protein
MIGRLRLTAFAATMFAVAALMLGCGASDRPSGACDPNYKGACLSANATDYDCASGSGNGPKYVNGPVQVVGSDPYGLDGDGNGVGCE